MAETRFKIELLTRENYDTWKLHVRALLIKTKGWQYANGKTTRPDDTVAANKKACEEWDEADANTHSDLLLSISPSELTQ